MPKPPRLAGDLIVRKGEAAPAVNNPVVTAIETLERPHGTDRAPKTPQGPVPVPHGLAGTIAVTVRLDPFRYERMKIYGVRQRRTNQELLVEALDAFLDGRAANGD